jgi:uncharacterized membrane protein (UPF0136 family)
MLFTTLRRNTTAILLSFVAAGFAFLLAELLLIGHTEGSQLVATGASAVGLLLALLALVPQRTLRFVVAGLFVLLALSGVYGAFEHKTDRVERREEASAALAVVESSVVDSPANAAVGAGEAAPAGEAAVVPGAVTPADAGETKEVVGEALNSFAENPPILSPLALSGLAVLGILVLLSSEATVPVQSAIGPALTARATGD